MAGTARPNYPLGPPSPAKVRRLQNRLWAAAKQSEGRRFHALYDRIYRRRHPVGGVGAGPSQSWGGGGRCTDPRCGGGDYGVERMLAELQDDLRAGNYRPAPVRRVEIPKPDGSKRPLGIPTVKDRVCQQAAKIVLEPIFEADFLPCSFGFRPKRSATDAMERIRVGFIEGKQFVFEADIKDFFGSDRPRAGCSPWSASGCRTDGCSSCCGSGCVQGCWTTGWSPRRSRGRPKAG